MGAGLCVCDYGAGKRSFVRLQCASARLQRLPRASRKLEPRVEKHPGFSPRRTRLQPQTTARRTLSNRFPLGIIVDGLAALIQISGLANVNLIDRMYLP